MARSLTCVHEIVLSFDQSGSLAIYGNAAFAHACLSACVLALPALSAFFRSFPKKVPVAMLCLQQKFPCIRSIPMLFCL